MSSLPSPPNPTHSVPLGNSTTFQQDPSILGCKNWFSPLYQCPGAATTNDYSLSGLEPQKCVLSLVWRPEVQNQGMGRARLSLAPSCSSNPQHTFLVSFTPHFSLSLCHQRCVCVFKWCSLCVSSLLRMPVIVDQGLPYSSMTSSCLNNYICNDFFLN